MDLCLGKFLETFVFDMNYRCPNNRICHCNIFSHVRTFANGDGSVIVNTTVKEDNVFPGNDKDIMMWKYCKACNRVVSKSNIVKAVHPLNSWYL